VYGYINIINYALLVTANSKHYKKAEISYIRFGSEKVYKRRQYSLTQLLPVTTQHTPFLNLSQFRFLSSTLLLVNNIFQHCRGVTVRHSHWSDWSIDQIDIA